MVPYEDGPLEGLPDANDQEHPWFPEAKGGDNRPPNYLRTEIIGRLKTQSRKKPKPHFRLQVRFKKRQNFETENNFAMFWSDVSWESEPWVEFATVTLTSPMDDTSQQQMRMNVSNLPPCMSIIEPTWSSHPAWIMHARTRIYPANRYVMILHSLHRNIKYNVPNN